MTVVELNFTVTPGVSAFHVTVDNWQLSFDARGNASHSVRAGERHTLAWFVKGIAGAEYTLRVIRPIHAMFRHDGVLDDGGVDAGVNWFVAE